ncbi:unnamed protein product [Prunus armeniaca]|uniref:DUF4219 domain-containing protein n=1 Tax=Prunus armeniaca TaxID=36596 RepID=A0A6J5XTW8_PRUAR|nr:unnamed protein product [Prunus armeniaca]
MNINFLLIFVRNQQLVVPVEIVRYNGENYPTWAKHMQLYLKELNVACVLHDHEPCTKVVGHDHDHEAAATNTDQQTALSKAVPEKWLQDDALCRRTILNHLSDYAFHYYSTESKTTTGRQLWDAISEDIRSTLGVKRVVVGKYMEFRIVEEKSIVKQVEQPNEIFDCLAAFRVPVDEMFHFYNIINKLHASWKNVAWKLLFDKNLNLSMVMERLRVEEESPIRESTTSLLMNLFIIS